MNGPTEIKYFEEQRAKEQASERMSEQGTNEQTGKRRKDVLMDRQRDKRMNEWSEWGGGEERCEGGSENVYRD